MKRISRRPATAQLPDDEARVLWRKALAPLMDCLDGARRLIVIPSGDMLGIPIEALAMEEDGRLVVDRFAVSYVPSATIHTWLRESNTTRPAHSLVSCLAIGDPPFSPDQPAGMTSSSLETPISLPPASEDGIFDLASSVSAAFRGDEELLLRGAMAGNRDALQSLRRLPATSEEARVVAGLHGGASRLLLGPEATEQNLVRMARAGELKQFRTIHIATHALVDDERPDNSALVLSQVHLPDPLEAALAGTRIYDGRLTAAKIVREWELDADLVTLSACETALGKKVAGEGYVGFAHAFLQAGARSLLVSLWKTEDRATSLLMQRFYSNWLDRGDAPGRTASAPRITKAEALQDAKRWLRGWTETRHGGTPYQHPFYWAGFVLVGSAS